MSETKRSRTKMTEMARKYIDAEAEDSDDDKEEDTDQGDYDDEYGFESGDDGMADGEQLHPKLNNT